MTVIVDANCTGLAFSTPPHEDFQPIVEALTSNTLKLVIGGKTLKKEYAANKVALRFWKALDRAGRSKNIDDSAVDNEEEALKLIDILKSDDPHVLALARISGTRLLCSHDQNLHDDFRNKSLIDKPRGSVYQNSSHKHLIRKHA